MRAHRAHRRRLTERPPRWSWVSSARAQFAGERSSCLHTLSAASSREPRDAQLDTPSPGEPVASETRLFFIFTQAISKPDLER